MLPLASGIQALTCEDRCVSSRFNPAARAGLWYCRLIWQTPFDADRSLIPIGIQAMVQMNDGQRLRHPSGGHFDVPLRPEVDAGLVFHPQSHWCINGGQSRTGRYEATEAELHAMRSENESLKARLEEADRRHGQTVAHRRLIQEELMNLRGRIRTVCRIRGLRPDEVSDAAGGVITGSMPSEALMPAMQRSFEFDYVFGPEVQSESIWDEVYPFVDSIFDHPGTQACIMAYGQTGAGKTFTMEGVPRQPGLVARTVEHLYERAEEIRHENSPTEVSISLSMVEVYQEQLYDLLSASHAIIDVESTPPLHRERLQLIQDGSEGGPEVRGARVQTPATRADALLWCASGLHARRVGVSERNKRSSRSHAVISFYVRRYDGCSSLVGSSKIVLVDLAGSERQNTSSTLDRTRVAEASYINQSLTTLGKVVQACIQRSSARFLDRERTHVPYRDSMLTRLLADCLGGHGKMLMLFHVTPLERDVLESCRTLQFAVSAACVQEHVCWAPGSEPARPRRIPFGLTKGFREQEALSLSPRHNNPIPRKVSPRRALAEVTNTSIRPGSGGLKSSRSLSRENRRTLSAQHSGRYSVHPRSDSQEQQREQQTEHYQQHFYHKDCGHVGEVRSGSASGNPNWSPVRKEHADCPAGRACATLEVRSPRQESRSPWETNQSSFRQCDLQHSFTRIGALM